MAGGVERTRAQRSWSVPRDNFGVLTTHSAAAARLEAERTGRRLARETVLVGGVPLGELRRRARTELFDLPKGFAGSGRTEKGGGAAEGGRFDVEAPLISTGHQPELFHPGVWAKNIAADAIARPWKTAAWNLVVDNDLQGRSSVTIPAGTRDEPRLVELPFDTPQPPRPWEEATVASPELFLSFGKRLEAALSKWGIVPWGASLWSEFADENASSVVSTLVRLRRRAEQIWDVANLEHPLSRLASLESFRVFAASILVDAGDFRDRHNGALVDYRRRHRIRSESHPVAALQQDGEAIESPFWIWRAADSQRGRLFVKWQGRSAVEVLRGTQSLISRSVRGGNCHSTVIELLEELEREGWKIRTRALTTTLFARLILTDLFIHGIGGAKYDELTDDIMRTFYRVDPPPFMVLTATLTLPFGEPLPSRPGDFGRALWTINDQRWNPERYLPLPERAEAVERKLTLVHSMGQKPTPGQIQELKELRAQWRIQIEDRMENARRETVTIERQLLANRRLTNRDFAWPLHPRESLNALWDRLRDALRGD